MLYLFAVALLAIGAKSQSDTSCGAASLNCTSSTYADAGLGVCGNVTSGGITTETCIPCKTATDCTSNDYYTSIYASSGEVNLDCYDYNEVSGGTATGVDGCYPEYCGDDNTCSEGTCISDVCVILGTNTGVTGSCTTSYDCDAGSACITSSGISVCVEGACNEANDCDSGETCYTLDSVGYGACVTGISTCSKDDDCSSTSTPTCATDYGICYLGCSSDSDCTSLGSDYTCQTDTASGLKGCGQPECTSDSDCYSDLVCSSSNECVSDDTGTTCTTSDDCSVGACITISGLSTDGVCVEGACNDDDDCDSDQTCYIQDSLGYGACVSGTFTQCTDDGDCPAETPNCYNSADYSDDSFSFSICYLGCSENSDCKSLDSDYACVTDPASGLKGCFEPECTSDSECDGDSVCDSDGEGLCVICADTADCTKSSLYGDGYSCQNNVCLADSCKTDSTACGDYVCTDDGECVICERNSDCTSYGTDYTCQTVDGVNGCYGYTVPDPTADPTADPTSDPTALEDECTEDGDCDDDESCVANVCRTSTSLTCTTDKDCEIYGDVYSCQVLYGDTKVCSTVLGGSAKQIVVYIGMVIMAMAVLNM